MEKMNSAFKKCSSWQNARSLYMYQTLILFCLLMNLFKLLQKAIVRIALMMLYMAPGVTFGFLLIKLYFEILFKP